MPRRSTERVTQVADDVFLARGTDTNWLLLRDGADITLIDSGYPGDVAAVEASLREIGAQPQDVRALLITHAHIDHVGAANHLNERFGVPAYTDPVEVAHAHRERLEQANERDVVRNLWRRGALPWTLRVVRAGATTDVTVAHAQPFPAAGADGALDLPGAPVPIATHGHTAGTPRTGCRASARSPRATGWSPGTRCCRGPARRCCPRSSTTATCSRR